MSKSTSKSTKESTSKSAEEERLRIELLWSENRGVSRILAKKALQYGRFLGMCFDYEELVQVADVALWRCARNYDSRHGVRFGTYAWRSVRNQIQRYIRSLHHPMSKSSFEAKVVYPLPTRVPYDPKALPVIDCSWKRTLDDADLCESLLSVLKPYQRFVLEEHYLKGRRLCDIADGLGVSRSAVSQSHVNALNKIRKSLLSCESQSTNPGISVPF